MFLGLCGIGKAIDLIYSDFEQYNNRLIKMRDYYIKKIEESIPDVHLNGHRTNRLPGNSNISFKGIDAQELLLNLDAYGICASAGSACTSGMVEPSHVLVAIGLGEEYVQGALRTTFGMDNTMEDVDFLIDCVKFNVKKLRQ